MAHAARKARRCGFFQAFTARSPRDPTPSRQPCEPRRAARKSGVPIVVIPLCNPQGLPPQLALPEHGGARLAQGWIQCRRCRVPVARPRKRHEAACGGGARPGDASADAVCPATCEVDTRRDSCWTCTRTSFLDEGGYIYSQGSETPDNPVGAEIVRLLQAAGIPLRESGRTRFGEPIVNGVISRDDKGMPIRDGSIDELLAANEYSSTARQAPGPAAQTVIVVETPAFEGSRLALRVAAQGAVLQRVRELWRLNAARE